ncbi:MAG: alcohol dehydrogenase catalytic domain-containing protein [Petrimonas sp.]
MIAVSISGEKTAGLIEVDKPQLKPGEVLVKIKYVGFCGSDLNTFLGKNPMVKLPVIPGHEIGGVVAEVSEGVPEKIQVGMACTVNPYTNCGHCSSCLNKRPNACRFNQTLGVQRDGAMCEYITAPWEKVITDNELSPLDFALVEPMSVGFHAVSRAAVTDLDTVMIIGCGMIGVGAIIRSAIRGAKVITVNVDDEKLKLAHKLGAHYTINSMSEDVHQKLTEIAFETKYFVMKELDIRGSRNSLPEDFRAVMKYLKRNKWITDYLFSGIYKPENAHEALEKWAAYSGKVFRILIKF